MASIQAFFCTEYMGKTVDKKANLGSIFDEYRQDAAPSEVGNQFTESLSVKESEQYEQFVVAGEAMLRKSEPTKLKASAELLKLAERNVRTPVLSAYFSQFVFVFSSCTERSEAQKQIPLNLLKSLSLFLDSCQSELGRYIPKLYPAVAAWRYISFNSVASAADSILKRLPIDDDTLSKDVCNELFNRTSRVLLRCEDDKGIKEYSQVVVGALMTLSDRIREVYPSSASISDAYSSSIIRLFKADAKVTPYTFTVPKMEAPIKLAGLLCCKSVLDFLIPLNCIKPTAEVDELLKRLSKMKEQLYENERDDILTARLDIIISVSDYCSIHTCEVVKKLCECLITCAITSSSQIVCHVQEVIECMGPSVFSVKIESKKLAAYNQRHSDDFGNIYPACLVQSLYPGLDPRSMEKSANGRLCLRKDENLAFRPKADLSPVWKSIGDYFHQLRELDCLAATDQFWSNLIVLWWEESVVGQEAVGLANTGYPLVLKRRIGTPPFTVVNFCSRLFSMVDPSRSDETFKVCRGVGSTLINFFNRDIFRTDILKSDRLALAETVRDFSKVFTEFKDQIISFILRKLDSLLECSTEEFEIDTLEIIIQISSTFIAPDRLSQPLCELLNRIPKESQLFDLALRAYKRFPSLLLAMIRSPSRKISSFFTIAHISSTLTLPPTRPLVPALDFLRSLKVIWQDIQDINVPKWAGVLAHYSEGLSNIESLWASLVTVFDDKLPVWQLNALTQGVVCIFTANKNPSIDHQANDPVSQVLTLYCTRAFFGLETVDEATALVLDHIRHWVFSGDWSGSWQVENIGEREMITNITRFLQRSGLTSTAALWSFLALKPNHYSLDLLMYRAFVLIRTMQEIHTENEDLLNIAELIDIKVAANVVLHRNLKASTNSAWTTLLIWIASTFLTQDAPKLSPISLIDLNVKDKYMLTTALMSSPEMIGLSDLNSTNSCNLCIRWLVDVLELPTISSEKRTNLDPILILAKCQEVIMNPNYSEYERALWLRLEFLCVHKFNYWSNPSIVESLTDHLTVSLESSDAGLLTGKGIGWILFTQIAPWLEHNIATASLEGGTVVGSVESVACLIKPFFSVLSRQLLLLHRGSIGPDEFDLWDAAYHRILEATRPLIMALQNDLVSGNNEALDDNVVFNLRSWILLLTCIFCGPISITAAKVLPMSKALICNILMRYPWVRIPLCDPGQGVQTSAQGPNYPTLNFNRELTRLMIQPSQGSRLSDVKNSLASLTRIMRLYFGRYISDVLLRGIYNAEGASVQDWPTVARIVTEAARIDLDIAPVDKEKLRNDQSFRLSPSMRIIYNFLDRPELTLQNLLRCNLSDLPNLEDFDTQLAPYFMDYAPLDPANDDEPLYCGELDQNIGNWHSLGYQLLDSSLNGLKQRNTHDSYVKLADSEDYTSIQCDQRMVQWIATERPDLINLVLKTDGDRKLLQTIANFEYRETNHNENNSIECHQLLISALITILPGVVHSYLDGSNSKSLKSCLSTEIENSTKSLKTNVAKSSNAINVLLEGNAPCQFDGLNLSCRMCDDSGEASALLRLNLSDGYFPLRLPVVHIDAPAASKNKHIGRNWTMGILNAINSNYTVPDRDGTREDSIGDSFFWGGGAYGLLYGIAELYDKFNNLFTDAEECIICYCILHKQTKSLPKKRCDSCGNNFHSECLQKWYQTSHNTKCPICRCV